MRLRMQAICLGAALALLVLLAPVQDRVDAARREATAGSTVGTHVDPETFVTTVLLAGFRAIAVDIAWVRAEYFERSGDLWAVKPMLVLITDLQPTNEAVWNHLAWYQAYNMSREEKDEDLEARWGWVKAGIDSLMEGLERNPNSFRLRQELGASILYFKCHLLQMDEAAPYFARRVQETYGRSSLEMTIQYLREAREIPDHIDAELLLCPVLHHAQRDLYDLRMAEYFRAPTDGAHEELRHLRDEIILHRQHILDVHARSRAVAESSYDIPDLPPR